MGILLETIDRQQSISLAPRRRPLRCRWLALATALLLPAHVPAPAQAAEPRIQDVVFRAEFDGRDERYIEMLPAGFAAREPHDLLIALHGHGSDRRQFIDAARDECRAARDIAAKHRLVFIAPDYRAKTSWMGPAAEADVVQIIAETKRKYSIRRVIVSGGSMGGTSALAFAVLHPELVDGVVSMNGTANLVEYENFQDAIRASYGGTKDEVPDQYRRRSAELHLDKLTMPVACTTGGRDQAVPPDSVLRLVERLKKQGRPAHLIHRPEGGHSTNYADAVEAYEFVLGKAEPK